MPIYSIKCAECNVTLGEAEEENSLRIVCAMCIAERLEFRATFSGERLFAFYSEQEQKADEELFHRGWNKETYHKIRNLFEVCDCKPEELENVE